MSNELQPPQWPIDAGRQMMKAGGIGATLLCGLLCLCVLGFST